MPRFDTRLLVLDVESTGTDPANDRVCELGAAYFEGRAFSERRRMLIDPGMPIPAEAAKIHGITDAHVAGKPAFGVVAGRLRQHLSGAALGGEPPVVVGYNALAFDVPMLDAELARTGHDATIDAERVVDPVLFVRWHLRHLRRRTLTSACDHFGVRLERAHRADADARATGELLLAMVKAGLIPDDVDAALAEQARISAALDREWEQWSYWLYADRGTGALRIGAGAHVGALLDDVDGDYLGFLLGKIDDLPPAVRRAFESVQRGSRVTASAS